MNFVNLQDRWDVPTRLLRAAALGTERPEACRQAQDWTILHPTRDPQRELD